MEGLTGVELLMVYALGFGVVLAAIAVWIVAWRWMWKQRGIGFAEGWFKVVRDQRAAEEQAYQRGLEDAWSGHVIRPQSTGVRIQTSAAPEPAKRAPAGPPRYLVPTEKE